MDGVESIDGVIIVAATNRPEMIDPALLRSGRFERVLHVPPPDVGAREAIFNIHCKGMPLSNFSIKDVLKGMDGFTGADIEAVCREAALICMRANKKKVTKSHFEEAIGRVRPTVTPEMLEYYQKMEVCMEDFHQAIKDIEPSALREIYVEVPEVSWDEIGGLDEG